MRGTELPSSVDKGGVTPPRHIEPGAYYLLTRNTTQRQFWLKPCAMVLQVFAYCLAYGAARHSIDILAVCVLSSHYHLVIFDPTGQLPRFLHLLNQFVAKCLNVHWRRRENLFDNRKTSVQRLGSEEDVLRFVVYCALNPVSAGVVPRSKMWPGLVSKPDDLLAPPRRFRRPPVYFPERSDLPEEVELKISKPPCFGGQTAREYRDRFRSLLTELEQEEQHRRATEGMPFTGAAAAKKAHPSKRAKQARSIAINPRVAASCKEIRRRMLQRTRDFRRAYFEALKTWSGGDHSVEFPAGTWWMRVHHGAACACSNEGSRAPP